MTAQRIKGQEVSVIVARGSTVEDTLTDVLSFNVSLQSETKTQGYLGETGNRTDDIYNQAKFDLELHLHSAAWFKFAKAINDRQRRITPDLVINITAVLLFPNGDEAKVLLPDCKFGETPLNIASRGDYVKVKLDGMCDALTIDETVGSLTG